jgi:hypothetical protein
MMWDFAATGVWVIPYGSCQQYRCYNDTILETKPAMFGWGCGPTDSFTGTRLGYCDGAGTCVNPERGRFNPLYMILDVQYSPPGLGSSVTSSQSRTTGLTTTVGRSFTQTDGKSLTVGFDSKFVNADAQGTITKGATIASEDSVSVVGQVSAWSILDCNPAEYCTESIDHRLDLISLLLNPTVEYVAFEPGTVLPYGMKHVTWGIDTTAAVVVGVRVGELTGRLTMSDALKSNLEGRGITAAEYKKILSATGYGQEAEWAGAWNPDPSRYEPVPLFSGSSAFTYLAGQGTRSASLSTTRTIAHEDTYSSSYTVGIRGSVGARLGKMLGASASHGASWTWTNTTTTSTSESTAETESFSIVMPPPEYSGHDKLYQTFMFSFCSSKAPIAGCASGPPLPLAPTELAGAAADTHSSVSVSWTPVAGATGYTLQRSTSPSSGFVMIASNVDGYTFVDQGATGASTPYYYRVSALNITGTGPESAVSLVPAAPTGVTAVMSGGSTVNLTWTPVAGATSYAVWRSPTGTDFTRTTCANPAAAQCTDNAPLANNFYFVTAFSPTGASSRSNQVQMKVVPTAAATGDNQSVYLTWTYVPTATSYNVQYSKDNVSFYAFNGSTAVTRAYVWHYNEAAPYGTARLTNGSRYYYRVQAVGAAGPGPWSAVVSATPYVPDPETLDPNDEPCPPRPAVCW